MIEVLQEPQWTVQQIRDVVYDSCSKYRDADRNDEYIRSFVKRIAQTELNRILFYAKEQEAIESGATDRYYTWAGPIDRRMTPMCRYLQTGELTGENNKGETYDYSYLRPELPEWKEQGWELSELKEVCRKVYDVFYDNGIIGTPMLSDWQMHINCRHTFSPSAKLPDDLRPDNVDGWIQLENIPELPKEIEEPTELYGTPTSFQPLPESTDIPEEPKLQMEMIGDAVMTANDTDEMIIEDTPLARYTFGFSRSFNNMPYFILPTSTENDEVAIFQFSTLNEYQLGTWLRFVVEELDAGLDMGTIVMILNDESGMDYQEIGYIQNNWEWLFDVALSLGWIL